MKLFPFWYYINYIHYVQFRQARRALVAHLENQHRNNAAVEAYKTVMCQNWLLTASCNFGRKCRFAHGEHELRPARCVFSRHLVLILKEETYLFLFLVRIRWWITSTRQRRVKSIVGECVLLAPTVCLSILVKWCPRTTRTLLASSHIICLVSSHIICSKDHQVNSAIPHHH
jgi:hypothetical protein